MPALESGRLVVEAIVPLVPSADIPKSLGSTKGADNPPPFEFYYGTQMQRLQSNGQASQLMNVFGNCFFPSRRSPIFRLRQSSIFLPDFFLLHDAF
jgi:hypothetical protein